MTDKVVPQKSKVSTILDDDEYLASLESSCIKYCKRDVIAIMEAHKAEIKIERRYN